MARLTDDDLLDKLRDLDVARSKRGKGGHGYELEVSRGLARFADYAPLEGYEARAQGRYLKTESVVELRRLLGSDRSRGSYMGDDASVDWRKVARMGKRAAEKAIVAAMISWQGYYGGEESFVDRLFE